VSVQVAGNVEAKTVISGTLGCFALSATVCHPECAVALLYSSIVFKRSFKWCEIWGFHGDEDSNCGLLWRYL